MISKNNPNISSLVVFRINLILRNFVKLLRTNLGEQIDLEIFSQSQSDSLWKRTMTYCGAVLSRSLQAGEDHDAYKPMCVINILAKEFFHADKEEYHTVLSFPAVDNYEKYRLQGPLFEVRFIELSKLPDYDQMHNDLHGILNYLNAETEEQARELARKSELVDECYQFEVFFKEDEVMMESYNTVLTEECFRHMDKTLAEKEEALAEKEKALAEKEEALAEKEEALAEKEEALAEERKARAEADRNMLQGALAMLKKGMAMADVIDAFKFTDDQVSYLKKQLALS